MVPAIMAAGAAISAYSSISSGIAQANILNQNAQLARRAAADAELRGQAAAGRERMIGSTIIGEQRARAGASGVDVQSGAVTDVVSSSRLMSALRQDAARSAGLREAYGLEGQARSFEAQADSARLGGLLSGLGKGVQGAAGAYQAGVSGGLWGQAKAPGDATTPYMLARPGASYDPSTFPTFFGGW